MPKVPYLNIGCGFTYDPRWTNVDFISTGEGVIAHNLIKGVPFKNESFEVVYHSHVLEHFLKKDAENLIKECYRVLKKGGIIRIAIPNLEQIARNYIKYLEAALDNQPGAREKYEWTMLEMYDQVVRTSGGGEMINYIKDPSKNNDAFLLERNGNEAKELIENLRKPKQMEINKSYSNKVSFIYKVRGKITDWLLRENIKALAIGQFRLGGEIHQWMYDRFSLGELLKRNGFSSVNIVKADESLIPNWNSFGLDMKDGKIRKPDSLFMEAIK